MTIFIALVIFVLSVVLFFVTWNKVRNIKKEILIEDTKKELESLLGEFNGAAARNIELLEAKIGELQDMMNKANRKITELDGRIDRANRPIVIDRVVPGAADRPSVKTAEQAPVRNSAAVQDHRQQPQPVSRPSPLEESRKVRERLEEAKKAAARPVKIREKEKPARKAEPESLDEAAAPDAGRNETGPGRSDLLKKYIREGRSRDELLSLGFQENEINLLSFFLRKHG